ncbi:hypothetical protein MTR_5g007430 [Medicago truncatula]|uniref:Uncharacterized protein n=1 Tax=Medicago truncatula TaxID=3880 RepID=G7K564_MEDTR|nr:hypothetical protein MTR_5g007430 [Medicago truncatula]
MATSAFRKTKEEFCLENGAFTVKRKKASKGEVEAGGTTPTTIARVASTTPMTTTTTATTTLATTTRVTTTPGEGGRYRVSR